MIETIAYFALLLVLYATECGTWTTRASFGLLRSARGGRVVHPPPRLGGRGSGFLPAPFLPWRASLHVLHPWPLALDERGVASCTPLVLDPRARVEPPRGFVPWDELDALLADGRQLVVHGREIARAPHATAAQALARALRELARRPADERGAAIDELLERTLDVERIRRRATNFDLRTRWTRRLASTHFAFTHGVAPAVAIPLPFDDTWLPLLCAFCAIWTAGIVAFARAHQALYPHGRGELWEDVSRLLLMPLSPSRMRDVLARELFDGCDAVLVAAVLGDAADRPALDAAVATMQRGSGARGAADGVDAGAADDADARAVCAAFRTRHGRRLARALAELDAARAGSLSGASSLAALAS